MPKYSIIVPVYNAEQYLTKSLESARAQTFDDIEIICVNDGSTDDSREIITDFALRDERIRLIDKPNGGPSSARNAGIDAATGEYICFLDSDDLLEPHACERLNRELAGYDVDAIVFGWSYFPANQADRFVREHADVRYAYYERFEHKLLFSEMSNPYLRLAIKRSALTDSGVRFDENLRVGEDCQFLFALYPRIGSVRLIADKLYRYRLPRPGSVMADYKYDVENLCMCDFDMTIRIFEDWNAAGFLKPYRSQIVNWFVRGQLYTILRLPVEERTLFVSLVRQLLLAYFTEKELRSLTLSSYSARLIDIVLSASEEGVLSVGERQLAQALFDWRVDEYGFADLASTAADRVSSKLLENKRVLMKVAPKFGFDISPKDPDEADELEETIAETPDSEAGDEAQPENATAPEPEGEAEGSSEAAPDEEPTDDADTVDADEPEPDDEAAPETDSVDAYDSEPEEEPTDEADNANADEPELDEELAIDADAAGDDEPELDEEPTSEANDTDADEPEPSEDQTPEPDATDADESEPEEEPATDADAIDTDKPELDEKPTPETDSVEADEPELDTEIESEEEAPAETTLAAESETADEAEPEDQPQPEAEDPMEAAPEAQSEAELEDALDEQPEADGGNATSSENRGSLPHLTKVVVPAVEHPAVSVIMPIYNVEQYLSQALRSVQNQILEDIEIICVNDGSTDKSLAILEAHAKQDHRIRIINKENGGYGAACNRGLAEARGTWIAIVEPDDWIDALMYRSMVDYANTFGEPIDIVKTPYWRVWLPDTENERTINCSYRGRIKPNMQPFVLSDPGVTHLIIHHPSIWSALYSREFLERNGIRFLEIPGAGWADNPFLAETLVQADSIVYLDEPFYHYREETPEKTANFGRNGWRIAIDRWHDMMDVYERLEVTDENIRRAHIRRGFTYIGQVLEYNDVDDPEVRDRIKSVFDRMDDDLVFSEPNVSPGAKQLYAKIEEVDLPKINPASYAAEVVKGGLYNLRNTGPAMTLDTLKSFVGAHSKREGKRES